MKRVRLSISSSTLVRVSATTTPVAAAGRTAGVSTSAPQPAAAAQQHHRHRDFFTPHYPPLSSLQRADGRHTHLNSRSNEDDSDNSNSSNEKPSHDEHGRLTEHEYQVRLGRAIQLLRATLPDFMAVGLADYPPSPPTAHSIPLLDPLALVRLAPSLGLRRSARGRGAAAQVAYDTEEAGAFGSIYHPDVLFEFMPSLSGPSSASEDGAAPGEAGASTTPSAAGSSSSSSSPSTSTSQQSSSSTSNNISAEHPHPDELEGRPSFSFSGRTLYLASAHVLRHTLKALFSEPHVALERLHLVRAGGRGGSQYSGGWQSRGECADEPHTPPPLPGEQPPRPSPSGPEPKTGGAAAAADELIARLTFSGLARVTHQPHEYTVLFRYTLDRATGQIVRHRVERIQPEVGRSLWTGLSLAWFRLAPHMYPGSVVHCGLSPAYDPPPAPAPLPVPATQHARAGLDAQMRRARTDSR
ncbi:hypothetical protein OC842_000327 [Tilletia horrida]|uniref:Uncharacterized protein n=1 Tax=Tilletia horrida TaxID=155126 RepID=A0AAN6GM29_9BASI|nr:hypothetical protein OC842_000327 [Tilletia horrida]